MASLESRSLQNRFNRVLSPVYGRYTWFPVERGEGAWLYAKDGSRVLDLTSGIAVMNAGHAHPRVVKAVQDQAAKLMHISAGVAGYETNIELAEELVKTTPAGMDTVFFGNSGAEAVEGGIKLARQATGRTSVITFRGAFHGRTTGAATLTSSKNTYRSGYGPLLADVFVAPYPYAAMCPIAPAHDADTCGEHSLAILEAMLDHEIPSGSVAAILIEPVLGEGGYVAPPAVFVQSLREIATRIGALLIFDEVQSGMGRTGAWWAAQRYGVTPDILLAAKALGGGMPLGAVIAPRAIHDKWKRSTHGSTFGGNPVSCAAGLATLEVIRDERLPERAEQVGSWIVEELAPLRKDKRVREIRRFGAMVGLELDSKDTAKAVCLGALERGVLIITAGSHEQVVRFIPPLNIVESDLRQGVRSIVEALVGAEVAAPA